MSVEPRAGAPAIAADVSWLCHRLRKSNIKNTTTFVKELVLKFVEEAFIFYAAFDPASGRHHTKKAAFRREFDRQRVITNCIRAKTKILEISRDLREKNYENEDEKAILQSQLKDLETKVKTATQFLDFHIVHYWLFGISALGYSHIVHLL